MKTNITLTPGAITVIVEDVCRFARSGVESGAWLLASERDRLQVSHVALLGTVGVVRRPDQLIVTAKGVSRLFSWAADSSLVVRAQVHSHLFGAFMSEADRRFGLGVEGFVSSIIPNAAAAQSSPEAWGWWSFRAGVWMPVQSAPVADGQVHVVHFDEDGVRG